MRGSNGGGKQQSQSNANRPLEVLRSLAYDPKLPFGSPIVDDQRSIHSLHSGRTIQTHDSFSSPDPSCTPSLNGEESDSTNGLGEFHLERYGQPTGNNVGTKKPGYFRREATDVVHSRSKSPAQKLKPGLNIITKFGQNTNDRSNGNRVVIDNVHANKPRLGHRSTTSIKSSKVEHQPSPAARSVLIGLSMPEHELAAHQARNANESFPLRTSRTPSILVTPAESISPWWEHQGLSTRPDRHASSVYSQATLGDRFCAPDEDVPPVPALHQTKFEQPDLYHGNGSHHSDTRSSFETVIDDDCDSVINGAKRTSSESQEHIMLNLDDAERPQSKGWWNLMLSPMLSRAGTLAPKTISGPKTAEYVRMGSPDQQRQTSATVPPIPQRSSPVQPSLPKSAADQAPKRVFQTPANSDVLTEDSNGSDAALTPLVNASRPGLAAEYYHACAVDSMCGGQYFECINHSCAAKLPKLGLGSNHDVVYGMQDLRPTTPRQELFDKDAELTESPPVVSPNVRQADVAPFMKAKPIIQTTDNVPADVAPSKGQDETLATQNTNWPFPPRGSWAAKAPPRSEPTLPNISTVLKPVSVPAVSSPGPISPGMEQVLASQGAVQMTERPQEAAMRRVFVTKDTSYPQLLSGAGRSHVRLTDIAQSGKELEKQLAKNSGSDRENADKSRCGNPKHSRACCGLRKLEGSKKKRWYLVITAILLAIMITCMALALTLTRKGDATPIQSQWLNLTGFPPMPTGISTIIRSDAQKEDSSCVQPSQLWSCSVPKAQQVALSPNDPDQPNFRFEITFRNGTVPANETVPLGQRSLSALSPVSRRTAKDPFTNDLFTPSPRAPGIKEQAFLGNTTDNITQPFEGEETPFYITFLPTSPVLPSAFDQTNATSLSRRDLTNTSSNNIDTIPAPATFANGTAQPANLLDDSSFPASQPIRLYNRGQPSEHYGFYTYYDKAIFLASGIPLSSTDEAILSDVANIPENAAGGAALQSANVRCTFSQTRFKVQFFTSPSFPGVISGSIYDVDSPPTNTDSATYYTPPGSFPYPATITLDRHGGDLKKKSVYCYSLDTNQNVIVDEKSFVSESRSSGGVAVNPAPPLVIVDGDNTGFDPAAGGIDGGTGGCGCSWQNWAGAGA